MGRLRACQGVKLIIKQRCANELCISAANKKGHVRVIICCTQQIGVYDVNRPISVVTMATIGALLPTCTPLKF